VGKVPIVHNYLFTCMNPAFAQAFPAAAGDRTMIVDSLGQIVAKTVHDHESCT